MKNILVWWIMALIVASFFYVYTPQSSLEETITFNGGGGSGNVYYMMHTHHVRSLEEPNMAQSIINAVRYLTNDKDPIDVLVFSNAYDRGNAVRTYLDAETDISATLTLDDSDLVTLSGYDVVFVHSNGYRFPTPSEQGVLDYLMSGGNLIGSHDVIWAQHGNPILEEVFGASAYGDGSNPGMGWYHGDFDACKVAGHPIVEGLDICWRLYDEQFYFDVDFKRNITVVMTTHWQGDMIPIAWTFSIEEEPKEIEADISCHPESLNKWSMGNFITCYIELPDGYDPRDIDANTILLNGVTRPVLDPHYGFVVSEDSYITDEDEDGAEERMVKFDRPDIIRALHVGKKVELVITGELEDGPEFEGVAHIRVFKPMAAYK